MYRKILVPLDGSERAEKIMAYIAELAEQFDTDVILLSVFQPTPVPVPARPAYRPNGRNTIQQALAKAESYLNRQCGKLYLMAIHARARVVEGPVVETILSIAAQENVDLIAMASHGRTGLSRVLYGSVAAGVLHNTDRPLLLIRSLDY
ncbi:MAG: universal stress protein [Anaerolineae bacterium]|nr:universal stress protein [Anaerolineae bacterium]